LAKGYGLHVGLSRVDEVVHGDPNNAPGCDRAAFAMRDLAERLGFTHTTLLVDEAASGAAFLKSMATIAHELDDGDILLLTLAGHGIRHVNSRDPDEPRDQAFLLFDSKLVDDTLYSLLRSIPVPARVVIVAEACYSGSIATVVAGAHSAFVRESSRFMDRVNRFPGDGRPRITANVLLLAAAAETTIAIGSLRPGTPPPFTEALLALVDESASYRDLHRRISDRAAGTSPFSIPVLNDNLVNRQAFVDERPFSII
jgi:hypothetical protein